MFSFLFKEIAFLADNDCFKCQPASRCKSVKKGFGSPRGQDLARTQKAQRDVVRKRTEKGPLTDVTAMDVVRRATITKIAPRTEGTTRETNPGSWKSEQPVTRKL